MPNYCYLVKINGKDRLGKIRELAKKNDAIVYITLSLPAAAITKLMKKSGIDMSKVFFISLEGMCKECDRCIKAESITSLAEIAMLTKQALDNIHSEKKIAVLDSVMALLNANNDTNVMEFMNFFVHKMKEWGYDFVIMAEKSLNRKAITELDGFCDKSI